MTSLLEADDNSEKTKIKNSLICKASWDDFNWIKSYKIFFLKVWDAKILNSKEMFGLIRSSFDTLQASTYENEWKRPF